MIFLNVTDWFSSLDEAVQFFLILGFATTVITCCALVMSAWNKTRRNDNSSRLTSQMLERGMSAAEVAQVLLAAKIANDENTEGDADPEVALVKHLSNRLYSANDVKIILDGVRVDGKIDSRTVQIVKTLASQWTSAAKIVAVARSHIDAATTGGATA